MHDPLSRLRIEAARFDEGNWPLLANGIVGSKHDTVSADLLDEVAQHIRVIDA